MMAFKLPRAVTGAPRSHSGVRAETAGEAWPAAECCVRPRAGRPVSWRHSCASRAERPEPPFSQPLNRTGSAAWTGSRSRGPAKSRRTKRPSRRARGESPSHRWPDGGPFHAIRTARAMRGGGKPCALQGCPSINLKAGSWAWRAWAKASSESWTGSTSQARWPRPLTPTLVGREWSGAGERGVMA